MQRTRGKIVDNRDEKIIEERSPELSDGDGKTAPNLGDRHDLAQEADEDEDVLKEQNSEEKTTKPNIATFRGIPKKLHDAIMQTASDLGVSPGELARYLLEVGLTRIEAGEDVVEPKFVPGGFTLYPDEGPKQPRRKGRKKSKTLQQPRSYYGVPREVVKTVLEKSRNIGVTQGEMARYLFERGLERYRKGELVIEPEPIQQIATLYPGDLGKV
ncbi:MAG TPA: hypothetical protein DF984_08890 [Anaerolineaceae bacterium]|nr:hypothetical protein [Anaerolineaceae bacterium]